MTRKIQTLNAISKKGLARLPEGYAVANDMANPDAILVRSQAMHDMTIPASVLCIGRAGAGTNNIPIDKCSDAGIVVFNTPGANANAVKELVIAGMLMGTRNIGPALTFVNGLFGDDESLHKQVEAGKLKLLAIGSPHRSPLYPKVPTLAESGLPGFDADTLFGVYAPAGMTFVFVIGLLIPNPFIALIAGAACICVEILLLNVIAKGLDKFPGIKRCGDNIRTAMSYVIDIALLIGGILAAQAIMPTTGLFIIVAFWCINKCSKKPLVSMAVGPLGAILVGLIANVLFLLSLYTPAA